MRNLSSDHQDPERIALRDRIEEMLKEGKSRQDAKRLVLLEDEWRDVNRDQLDALIWRVHERLLSGNNRGTNQYTLYRRSKVNLNNPPFIDGLFEVAPGNRMDGRSLALLRRAVKAASRQKLMDRVESVLDSVDT